MRHRIRKVQKVVNNDSGFSYVIVLIFVMLLSFLFYIIHSQLPVLEKLAQEKKEKIIDQEGCFLRSFYEKNAWEIDKSADIYRGYTPLYKNVQFLSSKRIDCGNGIQGHIFVVFYPGSGTTTIDVDTGAVTVGSGDVVRVVDGCSVERKLYRITVQRTLFVVKSLESYFKEKKEANAGILLNYFCNPLCSGAGEFGCTVNGRADDYLSPYLKLAPQFFKSAWGQDLRFDNRSRAVSFSNGVYKARVGFNVPWNTGNYQWFYALGK